MTTLTMRTVPVHLEEDESLSPLPWRRMAWVTWRQHRVALVGLAVLLGAVAVYLWIQGRQMHHAYGVALACHPASSGACMNAYNYFTSTYDLEWKITPLALQAVPALIGAFLGAPVLARELETGTFRYAWTQGFGRSRWTLAKLVSLGVLAATAAELFSLVFSWYYQPFSLTIKPTRLLLPPSICAASRSPSGRWSLSPSAASPVCSSVASCLRSLPPWSPMPDSFRWSGCSCVSTT